MTTVSKAVKLYRLFIHFSLMNCKTSLVLRPPLLLLWRSCIGIDRLQAKLFGDGFLLAGFRHQRSQIEDQIPCLIRLDVVGKRGHRGTVQASHKNAVDVAIGVATFWPGLFGEVVRRNRTAKVILKGRCRWTIRLARYPVALPALHSGIDLAACFNTVRSDRGFTRNLDGRSWFFADEARRKVFYPGNQIGALLPGERAPLRHIGAVKAAGDGVKQILVGGQRSRRGGTAFKNPQLEVARLGVYPRKAFALSVSSFAVAADAIAAVVPFRVFSMAGNFSDVALGAQARFDVGLRKLSRQSPRERENRDGGQPKRPHLQSCSHASLSKSSISRNRNQILSTLRWY